MTTITYQIRLDEPVICTALEGDPNAAVSYLYIPGSVIRGFTIGRFIRQQRRSDKDFKLNAAGEGEKALFFSHHTRYLNAYPLINGERSLPVPATWTKPKYKTQAETDKEITDNAFSPADRDEMEQSRRKPKEVSGFTVVHENMAFVYKPETIINVHNTRARRDATEPQVFRYEALADGQTFMGAILCDSEDDAEQLYNLLLDNQQVVIGASRSAGYGRATLTSVELAPNWFEVEHVIKNDLVLTFLSDTLLRDDYGVYLPVPEMLKTQLDSLGIQCKVEPLSMKTTWVGGFNRTWGLPLPQMIAVGRGSVVRLCNFEAEDDAIQQLIAYGIGERREDGFGRVALGWQRLRSLEYAEYKPESEMAKVELSEESYELWQNILPRIQQRQLEERVYGILYDRRYNIHGSISRTQISRLRSEIANELRKTPDQISLEVLTRYLDNISGKVGGRQLEHSHLGNDKRPLSEWLRNPTFEGLGENITSNPRYVLQLVDQVLERAYRARGEQGVN